jgi:phytoene dehydrogenase-like protein
MTDWLGDEHDELALAQRWPLASTHLLPRERWMWWEQLWSDVIALGGRYRIAPAKDWWENALQAEALAALAAWVARYDSGEWDDPPGKLALLYDLERVRELIRASEPFRPGARSRGVRRFLIDAGCEPPPGSGSPDRRRRR